MRIVLFICVVFVGLSTIWYFVHVDDVRLFLVQIRLLLKIWCLGCYLIEVGEGGLDLE